MKKIFAVLEKIEEFVASFFFVTGSIIAVFGVFMRYVLNNPLTWTNEIFETFLLAAIFIGFGMALKDNRHIAVDLLYDYMPRSIKKVFNIVSNFLGIVFSVYLTYMGIIITNIARAQGGITIDVGIPVWVTYLIMPVGMALLSLYFIVRTVNAIRYPVDYEKVDTIERLKSSV